MDPTLLLALGVIRRQRSIRGGAAPAYQDRCLRTHRRRPCDRLGKNGAIMWSTVQLQSPSVSLRSANW